MIARKLFALLFMMLFVSSLTSAQTQVASPTDGAGADPEGAGDLSCMEEYTRCIDDCTGSYKADEEHFNTVKPKYPSETINWDGKSVSVKGFFVIMAVNKLTNCQQKCAHNYEACKSKNEDDRS